jgi:5'(3')-deoxyribonucleotidase
MSNITRRKFYTAKGYNGGARRVFVDLDGVTADFGSCRDKSGLTSEEFKLRPGAYRNLKPLPHAIDSIRILIAHGFDVWIATKIPHDNPYAAAEKLFWVQEHIPELFKSVIITPNKGTLGTQRDFLIDDRPHKAHIEEFAGTLLTYGHQNEYQSWAQVLNFLLQFDPVGDSVADRVPE